MVGLFADGPRVHRCRNDKDGPLVVPSVIVPEEYCILVNPAHPDVKDIRAIVRRRMEYDVLFR